MTNRDNGITPHGFWCLAYRVLLRLLPHDLRARQGDAMLALLDHELRRSHPDGTRAVWVAGLTSLADLVRRAVYERLTEERRAFTTTHVAMLRNLAFAFVVTSVVLTALFVTKAVLSRAWASTSGSAFEIVLFSIPYTAALTIPMAVFIAVLWAASRTPTAMPSRERSDDPSVGDGRLRLAPVIGMASAVALCCLASNAELVPRANLRLQAIHAGGAAVAPTERSMTLRELRRAESGLVTMTRGSSVSAPAGASVASYAVEIQKKFALAAACVVLALLAAGIARRAHRISIWAQVVVSVVVFAGYYMCIIAGEQMADRSAMTPALAMWSANMIVLLLAMLTLRVANGRHGPAVSMGSRAV